MIHKNKKTPNMYFSTQNDKKEQAEDSLAKSISKAIDPYLRLARV